MSAAVGAVSSTTKDVPYNPHLEEEPKNKGPDNNNNNVVGSGVEPDSDGGAANSDDAEETEAEEDDDDSRLESNRELDLGPQITLKEQLEKDKVCFFFLLLFFVSSQH